MRCGIQEITGILLKILRIKKIVSVVKEESRESRNKIGIYCGFHPKCKTFLLQLLQHDKMQNKIIIITNVSHEISSP